MSFAQTTSEISTPRKGGGGLLPYVASTGTCGPIAYGFQGVLSSTGYLFHHFLS